MLKGFIFFWYGPDDAIPHGWQICNGTNGTPDLRGRWVIGAGGTYAVGTTGGGGSHSHNINSAGHSHYMPAGTGLAAGDEAYNKYTSYESVTGSTALGGVRPPYYALHAIMQIT